MQIYLPIAEVSVNACSCFGLGGLVGHPVGHVRRRRRVPDHAAAVLHRHPARRRRRHRRRTRSSPPRSPACWRICAARRSICGWACVLLVGGLVGAALGRAGLQHPARAGPGRPAGAALLRGLPRHHRRADVRREPERDPRARAGPAARAPPAAAQLGPRPAVQDEVPHLGPLHLGDPAAAGRACWSACWPRSWASAAASSWCPR